MTFGAASMGSEPAPRVISADGDGATAVDSGARTGSASGSTRAQRSSASPAGGHGSAPAARGRPRRSATAADAASAATTTPAGASCDSNEVTEMVGSEGTEVAIWVISALAHRSATSPAGGHGSPPATRGRPWRRATVMAGGATSRCAVPERDEGRSATGVSTEVTEMVGSAGAEVAICVTSERAQGSTASPAGGHESPPATRGRPRRSDGLTTPTSSPAALRSAAAPP